LTSIFGKSNLQIASEANFTPAVGIFASSTAGRDDARPYVVSQCRVAPVYRKYILAVQLYSSDGEAVIKTPADVRTWLPGDAIFEGTLFVPQTLKPGQYHFRVGLLDLRTGRPAIKLAIEGRQPDGWYDLGAIQIQ